MDVFVSSLSPSKLIHQKRVFPPGFEPGTPPHPKRMTPEARHEAGAAMAAISYLYEAYNYDVFALRTIF